MFHSQSGNLFAIGFTDTNGNYSAAVTPNFWQSQPEQGTDRPATLTSFPNDSLQVDATGGDVTNANIGLYQGQRPLLRSHRRQSQQPVCQHQFDGSDDEQPLRRQRLQRCQRQLRRRGPRRRHQYLELQPQRLENNIALAGYILNNSQNTNIAVGQAIEQDYVALPVNAHISGQVRDNSGNPVVGVSLYADTFIGGNVYVSLNSETDDNGNYSLGVASGAGPGGLLQRR